MERRFLLALLAAAIGSGVSACGFRPLLYRGEGEGIQEQLASVRVTGLSGRLGQHLRTALEDELNPTSQPATERYVLNVKLRSRSNALAIQLDNTATRYNLTLIAAFQLIDAADNGRLYQSSVRRVASYNIRRAPFATLTAEQDAERRATRELSTDIRTQLAVHFQRQAER